MALEAIIEQINKVFTTIVNDDSRSVQFIKLHHAHYVCRVGEGVLLRNPDGKALSYNMCHGLYWDYGTKSKYSFMSSNPEDNKNMDWILLPSCAREFYKRNRFEHTFCGKIDGVKIANAIVDFAKVHLYPLFEDVLSTLWKNYVEWEKETLRTMIYNAVQSLNAWKTRGEIQIDSGSAEIDSGSAEIDSGSAEIDFELNEETEVKESEVIDPLVKKTEYVYSIKFDHSVFKLIKDGISFWSYRYSQVKQIGTCNKYLVINNHQLNMGTKENAQYIADILKKEMDVYTGHTFVLHKYSQTT